MAFGDPFTDDAWIEVVTTAAAPIEYLTSVRSAVMFETEPPRDAGTYRRIVAAATEPATRHAEIIVDGTRRMFGIWRDEPLGHGRPRGWHGLLDGTPGVVITCSGLEPGELNLHRVTEIDPLLEGTREHAASMR